MAALFYRPLVRFFRAYIQKGGFRDGKEGFVCACYEGIYQFVAVSKIIEDRLKHKKVSSSFGYLPFCLMNGIVISDLFSFDKGHSAWTYFITAAF